MDREDRNRTVGVALGVVLLGVVVGWVLEPLFFELVKQYNEWYRRAEPLAMTSSQTEWPLYMVSMFAGALGLEYVWKYLPEAVPGASESVDRPTEPIGRGIILGLVITIAWALVVVGYHTWIPSEYGTGGTRLADSSGYGLLGFDGVLGFSLVWVALGASLVVLHTDILDQV